jgi:hypothetical protein
VDYRLSRLPKSDRRVTAEEIADFHTLMPSRDPAMLPPNSHIPQ